MVQSKAVKVQKVRNYEERGLRKEQNLEHLETSDARMFDFHYRTAEEEKKSFLENLFFKTNLKRIPIDKIPGNEFEILKNHKHEK